MNLKCFNQLGLTDIKLIKEGGQKTVYKAYFNENLVILKIVRPKQNVKRIEREIEIISRCNKLINTSVIYSHDIINCDGIEYFYIIESFIDGITLRDYIKNKTINCEQVIHFLKNMLKMLLILEKEKLVHRDIKPENIIVNPKNEYFLIDFGITRDLQQESLTNSSNLSGVFTTGYAPMEQIYNEKESIDSLTDLFSIGIVAYEMLFNKHPFIENGDNDFTIIKK